ncbi:hypothetical protein WICPIJ_009995 [Wickerhamomyces pijperi]|uniref:Uncharacterized protein n=1 Tax=Wickerhamomyces pijperi TaxID=599730 RepID=A0A9P8PKC2_WICPI|nr:hypothetical protein WICPIJ_009995 [Wickerhamomyces pijperi]
MTSMYQVEVNPWIATRPNDKIKTQTHKIFEILLISSSKRPVLTPDFVVFIACLVSIPVYTTQPMAVPEANTVLAHIVLSMVRPVDCPS